MSVAFEYGGIDREPVRWVEHSRQEAHSRNGYAAAAVIAKPDEIAPAPSSPEFEDQQGSSRM